MRKGTKGLIYQRQAEHQDSPLSSLSSCVCSTFMQWTWGQGAEAQVPSTGDAPAYASAGAWEGVRHQWLVLHLLCQLGGSGEHPVHCCAWVPVDGPIAEDLRRGLKLQWPYSWSLQMVKVVVYLKYGKNISFQFMSSILCLFLIIQWATVYILPWMCWLNTLFKKNFMEIFPFILMRGTRVRSKFYHF